MDLADRYLTAVSRVNRQAGREGDLTPTVLMRACRDVLPVSGAGVTMTGQLLRLPLGASDETTALVERIQATLGDGPCVDSMADNRPLVAGPVTMARCWPGFTAQVFEQTPYRSAAATPLSVPGQPVFGALCLYSTDPDLGEVLDIVEVKREIGDLVAGILSGQLVGTAFEGQPGFDWLDTPGVKHRRQVWMAVAIISSTAMVSEAEALATLRAAAQHKGLSLDEEAQRLFAEHDDPQPERNAAPVP